MKSGALNIAAALSFTIVGHVTVRLKNPRVPANVREVDVKTLTTALDSRRRTVQAATIPRSSFGFGIDKEKRGGFAIKSQDPLGFLVVAGIARDLNSERRLSITARPTTHASRHINGKPTFFVALHGGHDLLLRDAHLHVVTDIADRQLVVV